MMRQKHMPCFNHRADAELPLSRLDPFCPQWPQYDHRNRSAKLLFIEHGATRWADEIMRSGRKVTVGVIDAIMSTKCAQRLCLHVQILKGKVYVVAPHSRSCGASASSVCTVSSRQNTEGVAMSVGLEHGKWDPQYSPTALEWHFAAGLNLSSCAPTIIDGDFNGPFSRLRIATWLRLLEEVAREGASDTELIICAGETPLTAGNWCLGGAQPIFESVTNEEAPTLPLPHWLPRFRDVDFSLWDEVLQAQQRRADTHNPSHLQERKAVFRGGVYRWSIYSDRWREQGVKRTVLTPRNWRHLGRTALLHIRLNSSSKVYVNAHINLGPYADRLSIDHSYTSLLDQPVSMSLAEQQRQFRFALNIEGHGGWADRLYRLLLSRQLVVSLPLVFAKPVM